MKDTRLWLVIGAAVPLAVGALMVSDLVAESPNRKARPAPNMQLKTFEPLSMMGPQSLLLYTRRGERLEARYTKNGYQAFLLAKTAKQPAVDGMYKLQGGGRIKVDKGWIVWADEIAIRRSSVTAVEMALP